MEIQNHTKRKFSLRELIILTTALLLAIVTLIPGFYKARIDAKEGNAIATLYSISTAQHTN